MKCKWVVQDSNPPSAVVRLRHIENPRPDKGFRQVKKMGQVPTRIIIFWGDFVFFVCVFVLFSCLKKNG